ncbi:TPA: autotransporter domain-containing protein, partial [Burkholderia stabilis]
KLDLSGAGANQTIGALTGVAGSTVALGGNDLTFGGTASQTFAGAITGTAGVTKQGAGTETLTGVNTYTGGTTIAGGTLAIGAGGSLAAGGALNLTGANATFDVSASGANQVIGTLSGVRGSTVALGANGLTLGSGGGSATFGGTVAGTGSLTKVGAGTETLTGANTYTGGTTIDAGTLALGAGGSLAATGAVNLNGIGASLDLSAAGANQTIGALSGLSGSTVALGGNTLTFGDGTTQTFGGAITGTGGIVKQGGGTTTLTGANTYGGATTIGAGNLVIGAGGSLAGSTTVNLTTAGAGFTLGTGAGTQTVAGLAGVTGTTVALGGNTLTLGGAANTSFGGTIGGTGAIVKNGTGTQTLSGNNTYSGGTTVAGGTLVLGGNGALGTGAVTVGAASTIDTTSAVNLANAVTLNANATIGGTQDLTLSGVVSGAGGLVKDGQATLTLNNSNTFQGGTVVNGGSLVLGNSQALGTGGLTLNGGSLALGSTNVALDGLNGGANGTLDTGTGTLTVAGGGTFGGALTGAGALTKSGSATLVLTGASNYAGGTTIAGGTLQIGNGGTSGSIAGNVADSGALVFNRSDNLSFGGAISGTGSLTQAGSGQLTLTGTSTLSGPTTVSAGTLAVNGSLGPSTVTVQNGATLTGTGTIGGLVVQSGATAAASQPGAALNVAGNVTFQPGSTFQVAATPQQSGSLAAGGAATLNGGTVQVLANQSGYQPSTTYTILSAASGVQGAFSQVNANYAFLMPKLSYDPNHVYLQLVANGTALPDVATTPNQRSVATAIGGLGAGNAVYDTVLTTDASTARRAYGLLDGELQASMKSMLLLDSRYVRDAVTDRVRQGLAPGSGPLAALSSGGAALCGDNTAGAVDPTLPPERRIGSREGCYGGTPYQPVVWGQAFGGRSRLAGDGNASSINRSMTGFIAGADMALNDKWRAGLAAGVTHSSLDNDQSSSASVNSYYLSLYGGAQYGALGVRGGASYTWYRINSDRYPGFAGFSDHDSAGYDANSAQVFGEVGYALPVGPVAIEPFAGLAYVNLHTDGYTETGGAAALRAGGETTHVGFSTLGLRAASQLGSIASGTLTARGTVGWRHAFGNVRPSSAFTFANGGTSFQVSGVPIARDSAVLEAGIDANITKRLTLGLTYSGQFGSGVRDNAVLGNILWKF